MVPRSIPITVPRISFESSALAVVLPVVSTSNAVVDEKINFCLEVGQFDYSPARHSFKALPNATFIINCSLVDVHCARGAMRSQLT